MLLPRHLNALFFPLGFALSLPAAAEVIDVAQAQQNAANFRLGMMHGARRAGASLQGSQESNATGQDTLPMQLVYTHRTAAGQPAAYVFSTGDSGYIIASADDNATAILGYSTEGNFDPANIPDGMRYMFGLYAEEIGSLSTTQAPASQRRELPKKAGTSLPYTVHTTAPIEPLLETRWGQLQPYNRYCPFTLTAPEADGRSATGCMTTALAQIMRYHKHPQRGQGSTFMEVKRGITHDPTTINYYEHTYNWEVMYDHKDLYPHTYYSNGVARYSTDDPSVHHVAQLMFDLGVALRTVYGPSSGSANVAIIPALLSYFNYDPSIQLVSRRSLGSYEEWNDIIIDELLARRPVYLEGVTNDGSSGHAFVCDGYDGNGFFHINWGWDGMSNDYFLMTALDPYQQGVGGGNSGFSNGLFLVRNIKPNEGEPFDPYIFCADRHPIEGRPGYLPSYGIWVDDTSDREWGYITEYALTTEQWLAADLAVNSNVNIRTLIGILAVKPDGTREIAWDNGGNATQLLHSNSYMDFRVKLRDEWKLPGTRLFYVYQPLDKDELRYVRNRDEQICSFRIEERGTQLYAVIDRTEPDSTPPAPVDPVNPDNPADPDTSDNAHLASIYAGAGTNSLQLYPEFDPDVHVYLARRGADDYDAPGSCYISPYYTYTIAGTAEDSNATVSDPVMLQLMPDWNRVTITCTAADKKTTEQYHIILLSSSGGSTATIKPVSITDLTLMLKLMQPDFGYTSDDRFPRFINTDQFNTLVNLLLQAP